MSNRVVYPLCYVSMVVMMKRNKNVKKKNEQTTQGCQGEGIVESPQVKIDINDLFIWGRHGIDGKRFHQAQFHWKVT